MKRISAIAACVVLLAGCYYDNREDLYPNVAACDTTSVTYSGKVLGLMQANCYACHGNGNTLGNINLDGYANLQSQAASGKLLGAIEHRNGFSPMPQGAGKISDCDIAVIKKWINDGTPDN